MQSKSTSLLEIAYDDESEFLVGIKGARGLAHQALITHIDGEIGRFLIMWLNWQAIHCPEEGSETMSNDTLASADSLLTLTLCWREIESWGVDEWTVCRSQFIEQRTRANLTLTSLWNYCRTFYRRAEILRILDPILAQFLSSSGLLTDESIGGMRLAVNEALKDLTKAENSYRVLYAEPSQELSVQMAFSNPDVRRDIVLFLIYSQSEALGGFSRLPYNKLTGQTNPATATLLREARSLTLLRDDDIFQFHKYCVLRAKKHAHGNLTQLVPLAFGADADHNEHLDALLTCFAMSFAPSEDDYESFEQQFLHLRNYYATQINEAARGSKELDNDAN